MSEKAESHPLVKDSLSIYLLNIILTMIDFSLLRNLFQGDGVGRPYIRISDTLMSIFLTVSNFLTSSLQNRHSEVVGK